MVFYPAVLGWMGLSFWMSTQLIRIEMIQRKLNDID
jgi:hypothetical protein